ncbi:hypothetical protein [Cryptosporangium arvum]|uniref:Uncharacterized protein n=1 Tax=Cryptosporangium arvum DSM 44712 TaxID=927661 RepID=A0A010YZP0_9ACTN|nr:hypothetical protein [Cryptosporangium arvum]EXG80668.1 hypothetical protein CryarDRAFT_1755 [Cryptosporangium arvum DSM 44712]
MNDQSALAAALMYKRRDHKPTYVLWAAALVGLQAMVFALSALLHVTERDSATAATLGLGVVGAALIAAGLLRGNRVAYVMAAAYALVGAVLAAVFDHRPSVAAIAVLILLGTTGSREYFFRR